MGLNLVRNSLGDSRLAATRRPVEENSFVATDPQVFYEIWVFERQFYDLPDKTHDFINTADIRKSDLRDETSWFLLTRIFVRLNGSGQSQVVC